MRKFIVTTTINKTTKAVKKFDHMSGWELIVAGDLKTPKNYKLKNGIYLSPNDQDKISKKLSNLIGWNCIQRRNFALLYAYINGADIVATVDDDNIPYKNWGKNLLIGQLSKVNYYKEDQCCFDPISVTNHSELWHRGYPLDMVNLKNNKKDKIQKKFFFDIQADFWDGDPDIDAVCRMIYKPECKFSDNNFPFASNKISPFNSQNTFLTRKALKNYFMFPHIGRMDDIWASYYLQTLGLNVVYSKSSVYQDRNEHNLINDMKKEYMGYELNSNLLKNKKSFEKNLFKILPPKSLEAFKVYKNLLKKK